MSKETVKYTSSKSDIWNAYKEALANANSAPSAPVTTTEAANTAKVNSAVGVASSIDVGAVEGSVTALVAKIGEATEQYGEIVTAIGAKKTELKDILGLEVEANSMVAIVATKDALVASKEAQATTIIADAQDKASAIVATANEKASEVNARITQDKAEYSQAKARGEEEYKYAFARKKQAEEDALQDSLDAKVKVIVTREDAVAVREDLADDKDAEIDTLTNKIEVAEITLQSKIDEAVTKAKKSAEQSANIAKAMDKKGYEAETAIKEARIETLEEKVSELVSSLADKDAQVADANDKLANMANNALDNQRNAEAMTRLAELNAQNQKK